MKKCSKCKVEKPLSDFHKDKNRKDGHSYRCKSCKKEYNAKYRTKNKEKLADYDAKYRAENKEKIAKDYVENKEERIKYSAKYRAKNKAEQPNCVYQIKNLENNKVYIGETTRGELRWKDHLCRLRGNRHPNKLLRADFDKYGEEAFEWSTLKEFENGDKDNLLKEEFRTIQQFRTEGVELYNLTLTIDQLKMLT
jgi:hypothetical protein